MPRAFPFARSKPRWTPACSGSGRAGGGGGGAARLRATAPVIRSAGGSGAGWRQRADHARHEPPSADLCDDPDRVFVRAAGGRRHAGRDAHGIADREHRLRHATGTGDRRSTVGDGLRRRSKARLLPGSDSADRRVAGRARCRGRSGRALARPRRVNVQFAVEGTSPRMAKKTRRLGCGPSRLDSSKCSVSRSSGPRLYGRGP